MNWQEIAKKYESELIEKTVSLLKIPTVLERYDPNDREYPFGKDIRRALDMMLEIAQIDGFKTLDVDHYAGHIEMGEGREILGILGHLDVVPAGGKWENDPFSATIKDGKIFARGAMDDKGPTIAAYIAMRMIKDANIKLHKRVRLILGCDEESGMRGIKRYLEFEDMPDQGFAPDAEFPLIYGEKGIFSFDFVGSHDDDLIVSMKAGERYNVVPDEVEVVLKRNLKAEFKAYLESTGNQGEVVDDKYVIYGKNAHAAWPHLGVNAIFLMTEFLIQHTKHPLIQLLHDKLVFDHYGKKFGIDHIDPEMKELTINTAIINIANGKFMLGCNIRYPKGYDYDNGNKSMSTQAKQYGIEFIKRENSPYHYVSPNDPLIKELHAAYVKYTNDDKTPLLTIGGGTYARVLKKAVAFGPNFPGQEDLAHQPNEYLSIEEMVKAAAIYAEAIERLAGAKV
ncbi:MAG: dipeptidase PepV [Bacilli bacterium]|nr:dipeptidase PepV [Bacilli bacterium]